MKKILISLTLLVAMILNVFALAGCTGGGDDFGDSSNNNNGAQGTPPAQYNVQAYDGSAVTIKFYSTMGQKLQGIFDARIADFNAMFPNITVEHTIPGGSWDGLRDQINTDLSDPAATPNVAYCYPDHVAIYKDLQGVLPLDAFVNSTLTITKDDGTTDIMGLTQAQKDDFVEAYWKEGQVFDSFETLYTLPMAKSTEVLFYNKTFFESFDDGNGPLNIPTTWEEMEAVCRRIKAKYPNSTPLGYDSESNWFITRLAQAGAGYTSIDSNNHYLFNNLTAVEILEEANEWYKDGLVKTEKTNGAYTSNLFIQEDNNAKNKCFMVIGSTGGAGYQEPPKVNEEYLFEVAVAKIPQTSTNVAEHKAISQGPSLCLFNNSDPQKVAASWLLIKFLTTDVKFQSSFSIISGYAPVIGAAKEDDVYKNWLTTANGRNNLQGLCVKFTQENESMCFTSPAFNGSSKARSEAEGMMTDIMVYTESDVKSKAGALLAAAVAVCKKVNQ